jgi:Protein of unknown function (DUF2946)
MDQSVLDAQIRWPDVPAAYGWLSLSARGEWRLHPLGDAHAGGLGEGISNVQILSFFGRNYAAEPTGEWFFQNGPQRVYVRLDAAPFVLRLDPTPGTLVSHNGQTIEKVTQWLLDEEGQLYAQTNLGPARIDDRDLGLAANCLMTADSRSLLETLEQSDLTQTPATGLSFFDPTGGFAALKQPASFLIVQRKDLPDLLHFVANPTAPLPTAPV